MNSFTVRKLATTGKAAALMMDKVFIFFFNKLPP
jgi:hypothetical protein